MTPPSEYPDPVEEADMTDDRVVTVQVARELLPELEAWSPPVQAMIRETPGIGTGWEMIFRTLPTDE